MQQARPELDVLEIQVLVVTFESRDAARCYVNETGCPWPLLVDDARALYHAYGMGRAKRRHLWGLRTWWAYFKEALHGALPRMPVADTSQQGGNVLIDPEGRVVLHHIGAGPGNRPPVERILDARRV